MTNVQYPMTKESGQAAFSGGASIRASNGFFRDWSFLASLFIVHCLIAVCSAAEPATLGSTTASRFGNLPLYFEANRGQTDEQVGFFARGRYWCRLPYRLHDLHEFPDPPELGCGSDQHLRGHRAFLRQI